MIKTRHAVMATFIGFLTFTGLSPFTSTAFSQNLQPFVKGEMANFVLHDTPQALPDISFVDAKGEIRSLSDFKGKVLLVNFWATWCAPCVREMPSLDRLQAQLGGKDFSVLAIGQDRKGVAQIKAFLEKVKVHNLDAYNDKSNKSARLMGAFGLPSSVLVDSEGHEIGRLVGPAEWDSPDAIALISAVLSGF